MYYNQVCLWDIHITYNSSLLYAWINVQSYNSLGLCLDTDTSKVPHYYINSVENKLKVDFDSYCNLYSKWS